MAQSAKDYAKEQLGELDLSHLNTERDVLNQSYNTSKSSLENNFNNLINQINSNRADTRKNFNTGRATVAENSYTANRQNQADIASRVVGSSGLKGLGEVGNRMETGRQYSNLANQFYNSMNELKTTEDQGRSQYDIDLQTIKNTLDQGLASVDTREKEAQNAYNMTLGQLAEAVQGRWDSNANAQAALEQARQAAAQAHADAQAAAKRSIEGYNREDLQAILLNDNFDQSEKVQQIATRFKVDTNTAINILKQLGYYKENVSVRNPKTGKITSYPATNSGYTAGTDYYRNLVTRGY